MPRNLNTSNSVLLFTAIVITLEGRGVNTSVLIGSVLAELGYEENGNE